MIELKYVEKLESGSSFDKMSVKVDDRLPTYIPIIGMSEGYKERDKQLLEVLEKVINESTN